MVWQGAVIKPALKPNEKAPRIAHKFSPSSALQDDCADKKAVQTGVRTVTVPVQCNMIMLITTNQLSQKQNSYKYRYFEVVWSGYLLVVEKFKQPKQYRERSEVGDTKV